MSWLSELVWSNRDEHIDAMLTGDAELDESVVSTYDRPQGFKFKLAQRLAAGLLPTVGANDKGKTLQTNETTGAPEWAEASGVGTLVVTVAPAENGTKNGNTNQASSITRRSLDSGTVYSANKTVAEIKAGLLAGNVVLQFVDYEPIDANNVYVVAAVELDSEDGWCVLCIGPFGNTVLTAENVDDYPSLSS